MRKKFLQMMVILCLILSSTAFAATPSGVSIVGYDNDTNYLAEMMTAAKDGSKYALMVGAMYENQRNLKIEAINSTDRPTHFFDTYTNPQDIVSAIDNYVMPQMYTDQDVIMIAKVIYAESRGIKSESEQACIAWTILNRVDAGYAPNIYGVITAKNQFAYRSNSPTVDDYGRDLTILAEDVLGRWQAEKRGEQDVGRVLPSNYYWYSGHSGHNYFRKSCNCFSKTWNYSLPSPYDN